MITHWEAGTALHVPNQVDDGDLAMLTIVVQGRPFRLTSHVLAAVQALPKWVEQLTEALAWYYDQIYDGGERPDWVDEGDAILGELLVPEGDLRSRTEAVNAHLYDLIHPKETETDETG